MDAQVLDDRLPACNLGEGAYWDQPTASLYWVDILGRAVHRYVPKECRHQSWIVSKEVSFAYPNDGRLVLCMADGVYDFDPETGAETPVALLDLPKDHRLNDGKLDAEGRLWVGTINTARDPSETAALYVLRDDRLEEVEGGYVNANGKGWSPDGRLMYHADTSRSTIWVYDYEVETGSLANKRVFVKTADAHPDGLCIDDSNGHVLAAIYGGSRVEIYSYRGDLIEAIEFPVPNVTSCTLGGPDLRTLYVTTALDGLDAEQVALAPLSGQVFVVDLNGR